jgi:adiponectin receptor
LIKYVSRMPLFIHMFSAICCLGCSAFFHLCKDYSEKVGRFLVRIDYAGISILIAGSNTPPIYYTFFCDQVAAWGTFYLGLMYTICTFSFVLLLVPRFDRP